MGALKVRVAFTESLQTFQHWEILGWKGSWTVSTLWYILMLCMKTRRKRAAKEAYYILLGFKDEYIQEKCCE